MYRFLKRVLVEALIILVTAAILDYLFNGFSRLFFKYYFLYTLIAGLLVLLGVLFSSFYPVVDLGRKSIVYPELAGKTRSTMFVGHNELSSILSILLGMLLALLIAYLISMVY